MPARTEIWHDLKKNKWLFILQETNRITIMCNITTESVPLLPAVEIMNFPAVYKAQTEKLLFFAHKNYETALEHIIPDIKLTILKINYQLSSQLQIPILQRISTKQFKTLKNKLRF